MMTNCRRFSWILANSLVETSTRWLSSAIAHPRRLVSTLIISSPLSSALHPLIFVWARLNKSNMNKKKPRTWESPPDKEHPQSSPASLLRAPRRWLASLSSQTNPYRADSWSGQKWLGCTRVSIKTLRTVQSILLQKRSRVCLAKSWTSLAGWRCSEIWLAWEAFWSDERENR